MRATVAATSVNKLDVVNAIALVGGGFELANASRVYV